MKKLILLFLLIPFCLSAQKNLYEGLEANGANAKYQEYYSVYKSDKGEQMISGKRYQITIEVSKVGDLPVGITGKKIEDGKDLFSMNDENTRDESIGYPMVRAFRDGYKAGSFVLVGDHLFEVKGLQDDGVTFSGIENVYIKIQEKVEESTGGKKKKMTLKEKLAAAKNKLAEAGSNSSDFKKKVDEDYNEMVSDYLKSMKAKLDAHTLTSKEKEEIAMLKNLEVTRAAYIKHVNDSVWRTPEYQRILENQKRAKNAGSGGSSTSTKKADSGSASGGGFKGSVNFINDTGTKYYMFISSGGAGWWNSGSKTVSCDKAKTVYISTTNKYSDKKKLVTLTPSMCGKTIKLSTLL